MNRLRRLGLPVRLVAFSMLAACLSIATLGVSAASAQTKGPHGPLLLLPFIGHGVMVWGGNGQGQLGDGTTKNRVTPFELPNFADGAVSVSGGGWDTLLVKADGSAWGAGSNSSGQLGATSSTMCAMSACSTSVVQVGGLTGASSISAGGAHSIALRPDGTVWTWGSNGHGQLGDGTFMSHTTPAQLTTLSNIIAVSAGSDHSLALRSDGTVWAWGNNSAGQLGDNTLKDRNAPVQVLDTSGGALTQIKAIAAGGSHSLALKSDGTVWQWGLGTVAFGLAVGHVAFEVQDPTFHGPRVESVVAIAAGDSHDLALKSDGTVLGWGDDYAGQLGDGVPDTAYSTMPHFVRVMFSQALTDVTAIAAGKAHTLALRKDGSVWGWGDNSSAQLGVTLGSCGSTASCSGVPQQIPGLSGVLAIAAGRDHSLAIERARGSLAPSSINFPNTKINTASGSQMITLTNSGPGPIGMGPMLLSAGFSRSVTGFPNTCGSVLAEGQTCRIDINFTPTAVGPVSGTLSIFNDAFGVAQPIALSGRGTAAVASLSQSSLTFAPQTYQTASTLQRVTLTNTGDANLVFKSTSFSFSRPDFITTDYSVPSTSFTCTGLSTLTPGQSCFVDVAFYPYSAGTISGTLTFYHDAGSGTSSVNLSGTGLAPVASASPTQLDFPKQALNAPSPVQVATLTNTGSGSLHVKSTRGVYLSTPEPQEFWVLPGADGCTGATLAPGQSCSVNVYFMPVRGSGLTSTATLVFDTDASNGPQPVQLSGSSLPALLDVAPRPLAFGKQPVGVAGPAITLQVANRSATSVSPLFVVDGPRAADFSITMSSCPSVLNPGDQCIVQVTFTPSVVGVEAANLILFDTSTGLTTGGVQMSGLGS